MKKFRPTYLVIFVIISSYITLTFLITPINTKSESDALEAFQFMSQIRAYPNTDIPKDRYYAAFEYSQKQLSNSEVDNLDSWTSLGPNNIGGRSLAIAIHPIDTNIIFIGSASGGLWKSTTGGIGSNAWTMINTGYPSLAVSSILIDSLNPNIMYIGTGENYGYHYSINNGVNIRVTRGMYGIGILKTTNGGVTWTKSLDWSYNNQTGVWDIIFNPKNHNILYAATSEGVFKSINAGGNWFNILNYQMAMDLIINPIDTNILYVSVGNLSNNVPNANVGIYKSTNGGSNWTKLSNGTTGLPTFWSGKAALEIFNSDPNIIYASISNDINSYLGFYRTTNGGVNWTLGYSNSSWQGVQGWYNNAIKVHPYNSNLILGGAVDVYKSTDFGTSFTIKSDWSAWNSGATPPGDPEGPPNFVHADVHYFAVNPKDPNKVYIAADGGLYRSNNFGESFYSCNGGYVTSQFYASLGNSFTDSIFCIGGLQDNRAAFYQGNVAWYKTFVGDGFCSQVNSQNKNICYTEYSYGAVYRSNNGGVSWSSLSVPGAGNSNSYCFATPFIVCPANPNIIYIAGVNFYKSSNGGTNFSSSLVYFNGGKALSMAVSWLSVDTIYVGTTPEGNINAAIWRSTNGGVNWSNITSPIVPNRYPTDITTNPYSAKNVYVTFGGFDTTHVIKSTNGGINWIDITSNLPNVPHQSIAVDPLYPNNIYVGNDLGVYVSTNGGLNWYEYRTGMPYCLVFDLTIVPLSRKLRAATHGNGIYERKLYSNPVFVQQTGNEIPKDFTLYQNYPNPFNPITHIKYQIPIVPKEVRTGEGIFVKLNIYDIQGKLVQKLVNEEQPPGIYEITFNAANLSSGVYFYTLSTKNFTSTRRMVLLK